MNQNASKMRVVTLVVVATLAAWGCSDVGDNTAVPAGDDASNGGLDSTVPGEDAPLQMTDAQGTSSSSGSGSSGGSGSDDSSTSPEDASAESSGSSSGETLDSGGADAEDATVLDTGVVDAGIDSTIADSGADAGPPEASVEAGPDATVDSGGTGSDAAPADTGTDAPPDTGSTGGGLAPCTTAGQTNCVKCGGNSKTTGPLANGLCTPTQAAFVQHDIAKGIATAPGNDPADTSCYDCLFQNSCLNDTRFGDTGRDCGDPAITSGTAVQCLAVISCVLGSATTAMPTCAGGNAPAAVNCYCGTAPEGTTCQGNPSSAINGVCDAPIAAGLGFSTQDGTDVTAHFTDGDKASGVADQIINCAVNSGCTAVCLQ